MKIRNDISTVQVLHELRQNHTVLAKQQEKLATGLKIVGAGDDASTYAISERMRANIRGLDQAVANVKTGKSMLTIASSAIDEQVGIMRQIMARTMQASDDTYSDTDRMTLNKEISQLLDQPEDIATQTTYNGVHLLDQRRLSRGGGTWWFDADVPFHANPSPIVSLTILRSGKDYSPHPFTKYWDIPVDASGNPVDLYDPASFGKGTQYTTAPAVGTYVWNNGFVPKVQSVTGNQVKLSNGKTVSVSDLYTAVYTKQYTTWPMYGTDVVEAPGGLYNRDEEGSLSILPGSNKNIVARYSSFWTGISAAEINFSQLFQTTGNDLSKFNGVGFSLTCGMCSQYVSFQFDTSTTSSQLYIGEKSSKNPKPMCYLIGIAGCKTQQDIEDAFYNGIAMAGVVNSSYSGQKTAASLDRTKDSSISIADRHGIQLNYFANTQKFTISKTGPYMTFRNGITGELKENIDTAFLPEQLLHIQPSVRGSEDTVVNLPNTTLSILFPSASDPWDILPTDDDYPTSYSADYSNCANDAERRLQWLDTEWRYPSRFLTLDKDHTVDTREKANDFLENVHQAIKYLLYANTTVGAQSSRLDTTAANLVTQVTNIKASDSTLRDADMARELTKYVRANVLSESAQAMLAQANVENKTVLGLLK